MATFNENFHCQIQMCQSDPQSWSDDQKYTEIVY